MADQRGKFGGRFRDVPRAQEFLDAYGAWQGGGRKPGKQPMPDSFLLEDSEFFPEDKQNQFMHMFLQQALRDQYESFYPGAPPPGDPLLAEAEGLGKSKYLKETKVYR
jgi:hypothetical protein